MIMKKTMKKCSVLEVGGKPQIRENPRNQVGTENPIHLWTEPVSNPGQQRWKARKKHYANLTPAGRNWSILDTDVACYDVEGRKRRLPSNIRIYLLAPWPRFHDYQLFHHGEKIKLLGVRGLLIIMSTTVVVVSLHKDEMSKYAMFPIFPSRTVGTLNPKGRSTPK